VILVSPKGEEHMVALSPGKPFGTHKGNILHDDIIGKPDGSRVWTAMGAEYRAFRPTFSQYVMNLKRHAQIIYPKDIGPILLWADIFPGAAVVEAGIGWGAARSNDYITQGSERPPVPAVRAVPRADRLFLL